MAVPGESRIIHRIDIAGKLNNSAGDGTVPTNSPVGIEI